MTTPPLAGADPADGCAVGDRDLFQALFRQSREPLFLLDGNARLLVANPAGEALAGYSSADLRDMETADMVSRAGRPFRREDLRARLHALPPGQARVLDVEQRQRSGIVVPLELTLRRIDHSGRPLFLVSAHQTSRGRAELAARRRRAARDQLMLTVAKRFVREPLETAASSAIADIAAFLGLAAMIIRDPSGTDGTGAIRAAWHAAPQAARSLENALARHPVHGEARSGTRVGEHAQARHGDEPCELLLLAAPVSGESGVEAEVVMARADHTGAGAWREEDRRLLAVLCEVYALAVSRLRERTARTETESRFETFTRNLPGGVWRRVQEPDGRLNYTFFGGGSPDFPTVRPEAVVQDPDLLLNTIHPDDRPAMMASIREATRTLADWSWEFRAIDKDANIHWMQALAKPQRLADGRVAWDGITLDVTARKRSEQALRDSERRFRTAFNEAAEGMALVGADGRWIRVNQSLAALLGAPPDAVAGTPLARWAAPDHRRALVRLWRSAQRDPSRTMQAEIRGLSRDGSRPWVRIKAVPIRDDDDARLLYWVAHVQDISAQRATQALLVQARDQAEATARAKSEFLAMMSHEVRTPLVGMIGLARLLQADPLPPVAARRAGRLESAGRLLLGLIDDILTLSKAEAGGLAMARTTFSPTGLVSEVIGLLSADAERRGLRLTMAVAPEVPAWLSGPAPATRQVLFNLVGNALKFTRTGEIVVSTRVCRAPETAPPSGAPSDAARWLRFVVRDTGIGIAKEDRARIFEAFGQGVAVRSDETGRPAGGVGLGLALCRRMVEAMGGRIGFESSPGQGSRFWFTVPISPPLVDQSPPTDGAAAVAAPAEDGGPGAVPTEATVARGGFAGRRVMVVDDDPINREVLEASLGFLGCLCAGFASGRDLLRAIARDALEVPDLILMDLNMPDLSGFDTAREIRALGGGWANAPIVGVTAGRDPVPAVTPDSTDTLSAHLFKPIEITTLADILARWNPETPGPAAPAENALLILDQAVWRRRLSMLGRERLATRLSDLRTMGRPMRAWADGQGAMRAGDVEALAHRIRGAAATLGARALAAAAADLERAVRGRTAPGRGSAGPARAPTPVRRAYAAAWDAALTAFQSGLDEAAPAPAPEGEAVRSETDPSTPAPPPSSDDGPS